MIQHRLRNITKQLLSNNWYTLHKFTFDFLRDDGQWETQEREVYDRGNGVAILLYNTAQKTVVLTRQFRMPTYVNGNAQGMLIEVCAGVMEKANAVQTIKTEVLEETGYQIDRVQKVFEAYMSPGSVTELLHFFIAEYTPAMKLGPGGGAATETENIEVLEIPFTQALALVKEGKIIDGKTLLLLQWAQLNLNNLK